MANLKFWQSNNDERGETSLAAAGFIKFIVFIIIIGVVIYSEFMFISIIQVALPGGLGKSLALVGAVATGASVLTLVAAKLLWITPGGQLLWAWIFTGIEIAVMLMNDILAFALHQGPVTDQLAWWLQVTPASPVIALVGWILVLMLDTAQRERHRDQELEAKKNKAERRYKEAAHKAEMDLRADHLNQVTGKLQDVMQSTAIQQQIQGHAEKMVARILTDVSGINAITSSSPTPLQAPKQMSAAQEASTDVPSEKEGFSLLQAFGGLISGNGHHEEEEPKK